MEAALLDLISVGTKLLNEHELDAYPTFVLSRTFNRTMHCDKDILNSDGSTNSKCTNSNNSTTPMFNYLHKPPVKPKDEPVFKTLKPSTGSTGADSSTELF